MATALLTRCPHCGARFKLKDESAVGKKMKCRGCETPFTVKLARAAAGPARASNPAKGAAAPARAGAKRRRPADEAAGDFDDFNGDDFDDDFGGAAPPPRLPPRRKSGKKKSKPQPAAAAAAVNGDGGEPKAKSRKSADIGGYVRMGGGGVLGVGVLTVMFFVFFKPAAPITPPAAWGSFSHPKQAFSCEFPEGWEQKAGGETVRFATWTKGSARINIRLGGAGGALSDLIGGDPNEEDESLKPEAVAHESPFIKDPVVEDYRNYEELRTYTVQSEMGGVRVSEFTASGRRGIRATAIGGQGILRIACHCSEGDWEVCRPIFERVIKSLSR